MAKNVGLLRVLPHGHPCDRACLPAVAIWPRWLESLTRGDAALDELSRVFYRLCSRLALL